MDLLLYLVKKEEVDIYEVNLTKIAREFIEYVDLMREFDIEIAGEFLVMGYKQTAFTEAFHICFVITLLLQYLVACVFSTHIFLIRS